MKVLEPSFNREINGIPNLALVVVQHHKTLEVLMVAFTDCAGWYQTVTTGKVSIYSTSRKKSWVKGEESGNFMKVIDIRIDCDGDSILYLVEPQGKGVACHTNARSCFYRSPLRPTLFIMPVPNSGPKEFLPEEEISKVHPDLIPKT